MRKALENQTSIPRNSLSRIEIAIARFNAKINKTRKNNKKSKTSGSSSSSNIKPPNDKLGLDNKSLKARKKELERKLNNKGFSEPQSKYNSLKADYEESKKSDKLLTEAKTEI